MKCKPLPPLERLQQLFRVEGRHLVWNQTKWTNAVEGQVAGGLTSNGYRLINIDGQRYLAHRIAWYLRHEKDPGDALVDHIDRDKTNNDPSNLRLASHELNSFNSKTPTSNTSGTKGVSFCQTHGRWIARGYKDNRGTTLGYFQSKEEAIARRREWESAELDRRLDSVS